MDYYVSNKTTARVSLFQGQLVLNPEGEKGDTKKLQGFARNHPNVTGFEDRGVIEVLTPQEYRARLDDDEEVPVEVPLQVEEPVGEQEEVEEEEVEEEEVEEEEVEEEEVEEEEDEDEEVEEDLLSIDDFRDLLAADQREHLESLGIDTSDLTNEDKRAAAYEEYLGS